MAKNSITDYSKTAASNTDIQSVDIDEGCLPSGINNAIRELMADLADMNDGTVTLTSPSFAAATITGALASGSATVGSTTSSAAVHSYTKLEIESSSHGALQLSGSTGAEQWIWFADDSSSTPVGGITYYHGGPYMAFRVEGSERMRIDSSGNVGIGTTSPAAKLTVNGSARALRTDDNNQYGDFGQDSSGGFITTHRPHASLYENFRFLASNNSGTTERMRIDSSGRVGIGTSSPSAPLHVVGNSYVQSGTFYTDAISAYSGSSISINAGSSHLAATVNSSERMRIDSSGQLMVGMSTSSGTANGLRVIPSDFLGFTTNATDADDRLVLLNRQASEGVYIEFRQANTNMGAIRLVGSNDVAVYSAASNHVGIRFGEGYYIPTNNAGTIVDDAVDIGLSSYRYDDIYATNGTIQTSDRNEKQDIEALSEAEQRVAVAAKGLLRKFRWISSVEEKGDDARIHFGIIAQDLQAAFEAEGLDAGRYAMFINSTWTDEETGEERSRMGVRYNQLLAFIIAAI